MDGWTDARTNGGHFIISSPGPIERWEIICQGKLCKAFGLKKTQRLEDWKNRKTVAMATAVSGSPQKPKEV